jgi:structural maintenance of chromosome 1
MASTRSGPFAGSRACAGRTAAVSIVPRLDCAAARPRFAGKSNVMDAVCFVLGLSAKHMRGGSLTDMIYNNASGAHASGSGTTSAAATDAPTEATVRMVYVVGEYDDPHVPGGCSPGEELEFSRTVSTSGSSEFRVGGRAVTAAQYKTVLKSLNIDMDSREFLVFQGDVTSTARKNPKELMDLLEVVAGSAELKKDYEKASTERSRTHEEVIFAQRQARGVRLELRAAQGQLKEAKDFVRMQEEAASLKELLALWKLWQVDAEMAKAAADKESAEAAVEEATGEEEAQDAAIKGAAEQVKAAAKSLRTAETSAQMARKAAQDADAARQDSEARLKTEEGRVKQAGKAAGQHRKRAEQFEKEYAQHLSDAASIRKRMEMLESSESSDEEEQGGASSSTRTPAKGRESDASLVSSIRKSIRKSSNVKLKTAKQRSLYEQLRLEAHAKSAEERSQMQTLRREIQLCDKDVSKYGGEMSGIERQRRRLVDQLEETQRRVTEIQSTLSEAVEERRRIERDFASAADEVAKSLRRQEELATDLSHVRREIAAAEAAMHESRAERSASEALSSLMERFGEHSVYGRVGDLVSPSQSRFELAIDVGLGRLGDAVVVDTEATARECVQALREMRAKGMMFLPLASLRPKPVSEEVDRIAVGGRYRLLKDVVKCEDHVRLAVDMACGDTVLAETMEDAISLRYASDVRCRVVAVDGTLLSKNGNFSGGAADDVKRGPSKRSSEKVLQEARAKRDSLIVEYETCRKVTGRAEGGDGPSAAIRQRLEDMETAIANARRREGALKADLKGSSEQLKARGKELEAIEAQRSEMEGPLKEATARRDALRAQVEELQGTITEMEDVVYEPLLRELGVDSMRALGGDLHAQEEEALRLRREQVEQISSLESAAARQLSNKEAALASAREAEDRAEASRVLIERFTATLKEAAATAVEAARVLAESMEAVEHAKTEADQAKTAVLKAKKARSASGSKRAAALRKAEAASTELKRQEFRRHDALLKARVEGLSLPVLDTLPASLATSSSSSSSSSKGRKGRRSNGDSSSSQSSSELASDSVTSSARDAEASTAVQLDYSELEARLGIRDGTPRRELENKVQSFEQQLAQLKEDMEAATPNLRASDQVDAAQRRLADAEARLKQTNADAEEAERVFKQIEYDRLQRFTDCVKHIQGNIDGMFRSLTRSTRFPQGGTATLHLFDEHSPFEGGGVNYSATFPGKTMRALSSLSGGEKTVAALALLFSVHAYRRAPFFIMDEVDAALDSANVHKVSHYIRQRATHHDPDKRVQCLVISLKDAFFHKASSLVGVCKDLHAPNLTSRSLTLELDEFGGAVPAAPAALRDATPSRSGHAATPSARATPSGGLASGPMVPPSTGLSSLAGAGAARPRREQVEHKSDDEDEEAPPPKERKAAAPRRGKRARSD